MPDIEIFSSAEERQKFIQHKKLSWYKTFEYVNRHWGVDYVLNYIMQK